MNQKNKSILITGGTGFLGRNLIKGLVKVYPKDEMLCLIFNNDSPLEISGRKVIDKLRVQKVKVNLATNEGLKNLPRKPRLIFHIAAETNTSTNDHRVNDKGLINFYKSIGPLNSKTHFIHVSTMVTVAGRPLCNLPINENSRDFPTNEYTRTKLEGEKYLIRKCRQHKFKLTVIRPNTIYGRGVRKDSLFDMLKMMILNRSIVTKINWPGKSAIIHVNDVVSALLSFSKKLPRPGIPEKYLLYTENLSIFELSRAMHKEMKIDFNPIYLPSLLWIIIGRIRTLIPFLEKLLRPEHYNWLWRFGLIVDNVVYPQTDKALKILKNRNPVYFLQKGVKDVI